VHRREQGTGKVYKDFCFNNYVQLILPGYLKTQNMLRPEHIDKIATAYLARTNEDKYI
jgi:hypothetical protein